MRFRRHVLAVDQPPCRGDIVVDLEGAWVLPGLVNAHDHLELNHYGAWPGRGCYSNASEWMSDVGRAVEHDDTSRRRRAWPLQARLFFGSLKNVLAGVTTVAHHNPFYAELRRSSVIRVVRRYGWAHSFALERGRAGANGESAGGVASRHAATPSHRPFIVHLAEGCDETARDELRRFESLGCLTPNAVLVHSVALADRDFDRLRVRGAAVVWCPSSNLAMFGRTATVASWIKTHPAAQHHVCLGTDSRLTGSRDLLDEIRVAASVEPTLVDALLPMTTSVPARVLRLRHGGRIASGDPADLVVLPPGAPSASAALRAASRSQVALVVVNGRPLVGAPTLRPIFWARGVSLAPLVVDGVEKLAALDLVARVRALPEAEPGVQCPSCA